MQLWVEAKDVSGNRERIIFFYVLTTSTTGETVASMNCENIPNQD